MMMMMMMMIFMLLLIEILQGNVIWGLGNGYHSSQSERVVQPPESLIDIVLPSPLKPTRTVRLLQPIRMRHTVTQVPGWPSTLLSQSRRSPTKCSLSGPIIIGSKEPETSLFFIHSSVLNAPSLVAGASSYFHFIF